jgi:3-methyladenine DNA glycosylase AlkC
MKQRIEKRKAKKGQGVPKETRESSVVPSIFNALRSSFPKLRADEVLQAIEDKGYFEASMVKQTDLLAELLIDITGGTKQVRKLYKALIASTNEKVHAVAGTAVFTAFAGDRDVQLSYLKKTAALPGTWPREQSNLLLHRLIIEAGFAIVFAEVRDWLYDDDEAVRRVVAEAFRPRGVMIPHIDELKENPELLHSVLEPLLDDSSLYVRNAVANNLNDISKDNPDTVLAWIRAWNIKDAGPERRCIFTRGLRGLIGQSNAAALEILGFGSARFLHATNVSQIPSQVEIDSLLPFRLDIRNSGPSTKCIVLLFIDAPGKGRSRRKKRYQLWKGEIGKAEQREAGKRIHFVHNNSQPKERGLYSYSFLVNGLTIEGGEFRY